MAVTLFSNFTANFYKDVHKLKERNWSLNELLILSPLDINIFKSLILADKK